MVVEAVEKGSDIAGVTAEIVCDAGNCMMMAERVVDGHWPLFQCLYALAKEEL